MKAARIPFPWTHLPMNFPTCLSALSLRASFASTCRFAAAVLLRLSVLLLFGPVVHAQTAHLSSVQSILSLPSALNYPQEIAVDGSDNIYIADAYNKRVLKLTPSASGGFTQSTIGTGWNIPYGLAVDASGNVYVADIFFTTLIKETPSGNGYTQSTIGSELYDAVSLAVDKQGNVYGVEINNSFVGTMFKETLSGGTYTQSFIPVPGTHGVSSVSVDGNGNLYVNDGWDGGQLYKMSPVGNNLYTTTEFLSMGGAIFIDSQNDIYIGNYQGIYKMTPSGGGYTTTSIPTNATNTPYGYFGPTGLAVDANGNIYFTDIYTYSLIEESMSSGNFGLVDVGYSSYPVSLFFTFDSFGYMQSTTVSTQGSSSPLLDFSDAGTGDCYPASYGVGYTCWIDVTFTPSAAGVRSGAASLIDSNGNTIATGYVQGTGVAPLVNFSPGTSISENIASDGSAVAVDANGNLYTVTPGASTAFEDIPAGGPGNWTETAVGSGLGSATGIAIDGGGDLYIADQANREIVKETLTPNGYEQSVIANQSNGLSQPTGVAVDESGNVYVTDPGTTNGVFKETPSAGGYVQSAISTSTISQPGGIAVDSIGSVYIADTNNNRVVKETHTGANYTEKTIVSGLSSPTAVAVDGFGNLYISETSAGLVLKETLVAGSYVRSIMASGITPYGLAVDSNLNLYIAGSGSQMLLKLDVSDAPTLNFATTRVGLISADSPKNIELSNSGNAPLSLAVPSSGNNPSIGAGFLLGSGANDCPVLTSISAAPGTLNAGASCLLSISFSPVSSGSNSGALTILDNNLNAPAPNYTSQSIALQGTGIGLPQTIIFAAIATQNIGVTLNFSATASSGLAVSYLSTTPGVCTISGSSASLIAAGTCTIQASQAGNAIYGVAPTVSRSFTVSKLSQNITFAAIATQHIGAFNLSATSSSGLAVSYSSLTLSVCTVSGNSVSLNAAGTCAIQASQAGNATYSPAPNVDQSFTVNKLSQTIAFAAVATQNIGATQNLSATASSGLAVSYSSSTLSVCTVSGKSVSLIAAGTCTIQASQAGNATYSAATTVSQSFTVSKLSQTINFAAIATQNIGTTLNLSAASSSGLAVSYSSTTLSVCTVSGKSVSVIATGTCTIQASQAGNSTYSAAPNVDQSFTVNKLSQTINFAAIAPQYIGTSLNLSATSSSGLAVSYSSSTLSVCTVSGRTVSLIAAGTCTIQASQAGNTTYGAAPNVDQSFTVNKLPQTIIFPTIAAQKIGIPFNLSATSSSGLGVSFSSTTPGICTVSGRSVSLIATGTCTIEASQAGNATYSPAPNVDRSFTVKP